jgi:hypothetical protein
MELKKKPRKQNSFGSFRKIQEKEDHGFKGTAKKKKTILGTLEKTMKRLRQRLQVFN